MSTKTNLVVALFVSPLIAAGCASDKNKPDHETMETVKQTHIEQPGEDYQKTELSKVETTVNEDDVEVTAQRTEVVERPGQVDYTKTTKVEVTADGNDVKTKRSFDVDLVELGPDEKVVKVKRIRIEPRTPRMVHFGFDSAKLDARDKMILRDHAEWFRKNPDARIVIEGHTDERGSDDYNFELAEERAEAVMEYMLELGVKPSQLEIVALGEIAPLAKDGTERAYLINRRVELETARK